MSFLNRDYNNLYKRSLTLNYNKEGRSRAVNPVSGISSSPSCIILTQWFCPNRAPLFIPTTLVRSNMSPTNIKKNLTDEWKKEWKAEELRHDPTMHGCDVAHWSFPIMFLNDDSIVNIQYGKKGMNVRK